MGDRSCSLLLTTLFPFSALGIFWGFSRGLISSHIYTYRSKKSNAASLSCLCCFGSYYSGVQRGLWFRGTSILRLWEIGTICPFQGSYRKHAVYTRYWRASTWCSGWCSGPTIAAGRPPGGPPEAMVSSVRRRQYRVPTARCKQHV